MRDGGTARIGLSLWGELAFWPAALADHAYLLGAGLPGAARELQDLAAAYADGLHGLAALVEETLPCAQTHWGAAVGSGVAGRLAELVGELAGLVQYVAGEQAAGRMRTGWPDALYAAALLEIRTALLHLDRLADGEEPVPVVKLLELHQRWLQVQAWLGEALVSRLSGEPEDASAVVRERVMRGRAQVVRAHQATVDLGAVLALAPRWVPRLGEVSQSACAAVEEWLAALPPLSEDTETAAGAGAVRLQLVDHMARTALYYLRQVRRQLALGPLVRP